MLLIFLFVYTNMNCNHPSHPIPFAYAHLYDEKFCTKEYYYLELLYYLITCFSWPGLPAACMGPRLHGHNAVCSIGLYYLIA